MLHPKKSPSITPARSSLAEGVARELKRLFWWGAALSLFLALISYSPSDPSFSTWSSKTSFHNWMGRLGSILSDLCFQVFGLASFVLCGLFATSAIRRDEESQKPFSKGDALILFFLLVSVGVCFQIFIPKSWVPWNLRNAGGLAGKSSADLLGYLVGALGAKLFSVLFFLGSLILVLRWRIITFLTAAAEKHVPLVQARTRLLVQQGWGKLKSIRRQKPPSSPPISIPSPVKASLAETSVQKPLGISPIAATATAAIPATSSALLSKPSAGDETNPDHEIYRVMASKLPSRSAASEKKSKKPIDGNFQLPELGLLSGRADTKTKSVDRAWYLEKAGILVQKLKDFGVEGEVVNISPGPVITVYEFKPASGVKIKEIANLSDDLTLALSVLSVRIVAPIPGKPVVGIEIPSPHREMVFFKDLIQETNFFSTETRIPVVLGRLASGEPVVADLAAMPHVLVAGATGTGKSVFINTLIASLLYRYTPRQLKLILVDPKMVELSSYENIPHLLLPVVVDSKKAAMALRWTVDEMERRYSLMHKFNVRHIDAYNEKFTEAQLNRQPLEEGHGFLPYIVVVIDEYADLMAVVPKDVELSIARLAQKARASGIHLVLATQRPSTDVVTGTIKANFPSRISFRVASQVDSKTILDRTGAERLLGNGDLLFHSAGFMSLKRMQGAYISDEDIERVVSYLKAQGEPEFDERILQAQEMEGDAFDESSGGGGDEEARLYDQAVRLVAEKGEASISLIQRHLRIGYNRAASLMEQMEKEGVVSAETGTSKRRTVLINNV